MSPTDAPAAEGKAESAGPPPEDRDGGLRGTHGVGPCALPPTFASIGELVRGAAGWWQAALLGWTFVTLPLTEPPFFFWLQSRASVFSRWQGSSALGAFSMDGVPRSRIGGLDPGGAGSASRAPMLISLAHRAPSY